MDLYQTVHTQMQTVRLPLFAVTLTALPRLSIPSLLILHWHGFRRDVATGTEARERLAAVPSSALQLAADWPDLRLLESAVLDTAWQLGAWELGREERRACNVVGVPEHEAQACRQAFGDDPLRPFGSTPMISEAPDRDELMRLAGQVGYVRWSFRPVCGGVWQEVAEDDTLAADGSRPLPCPVAAQPVPVVGNRQTRYRLGRASRLVVVG